MTAPTFALIGAAGYVAPKHGAAIKAVGGRLVAACDVHDAVGWLDRDWPECRFANLAQNGRFLQEDPDFVVICSPNDLHHPLIYEALGYDVICEKPMVLSAMDTETLASREEESGHRVYTILNLRHHPEMLAAKAAAEASRPARVDIRYATPRGPWYDVSWKGDPARSGGLLFNLGIHILDAILWMFGPATTARVVDHGKRWAQIETTHAHALYPTTHVSISLTSEITAVPCRKITFDGALKFDLGAKFSLAEGGLHALCYQQILDGLGPGIDEARPSIELAERLTGEM